MTWKNALGFVFFLIVIVLLVFYWFIPLDEIEFGVFRSGNFNFTLNSSTNESMQFYDNLRYSESRISYRIQECPLQKADDMRKAFDVIENN